MPVPDCTCTYRARNLLFPVINPGLAAHIQDNNNNTLVCQLLVEEEDFISGLVHHAFTEQLLQLLGAHFVGVASLRCSGIVWFTAVIPFA